MRQADQLADHLQRQRQGELPDQVGMVVSVAGVDEPVCDLLDPRLERPYPPGREGLGYQAAGPGVLGRVLVEQDPDLGMSFLQDLCDAGGGVCGVRIR